MEIHAIQGRFLVEFYSRSANHARDDLFAVAFVCVATTVRDSWRLSITEASVLGVPGAVYPVLGLCNLIIH